MSGKKLEVPVKGILAGTPADQAASQGAWLARRLAPLERLAADRSALR